MEFWVDLLLFFFHFLCYAYSFSKINKPHF